VSFFTLSRRQFRVLASLLLPAARRREISSVISSSAFFCASARYLGQPFRSQAASFHQIIAATPLMPRHVAIFRYLMPALDFSPASFHAEPAESFLSLRITFFH